MSETRPKVELKLDEELSLPFNFFRFSPHGTFLAQFESESHGFYEDKRGFFYLHKLETGEKLLLATVNGFFSNFKFSADEKLFAAVRNNDREQTEILIFDVETRRLLRQLETPVSDLIRDWQATADDFDGYLQCGIFLSYFDFETTGDNDLTLRTVVSLGYGPDGGPSPSYGSFAVYHANYKITNGGIERRAEWLKDINPQSNYRCDDKCSLLSFGIATFEFGESNTEKIGELKTFTGELKDIIRDTTNSNISFVGVKDSSLTIYDFHSQEIIWQRDLNGERIKTAKFLGDNQTLSAQTDKTLYLFTGDGVQRLKIAVPHQYYAVAAQIIVGDKLFLVTDFEQRLNLWEIEFDAPETETEIVSQTIAAARKVKETRRAAEWKRAARWELFKDWWYVPIIALAVYLNYCR